MIRTRARENHEEERVVQSYHVHDDNGLVKDDDEEDVSEFGRGVGEEGNREWGRLD